MKIGGEVDDLRGGRVVSAGAGIGKTQTVDAVGVLIHKDKGFGGVYDGRQFVVNPPDRLTLVVGSIKPFTIFAEDLAHADAAHSWQKLRTDSNRGAVAGAFENRDAFADVGQDWCWG